MKSPGTIGMIAAVVLAVGSFVMLASVMATANSDDVNLFVTVGNAGPTIGAIICAPTSYTPTPGQNTTIWCYATITDSNGFADINQNSLNVTIYGNGSTLNAPDDLNHHYSNGTSSHRQTDCSWTGASGTQITANCTFLLRHYMDPGIFNVTFNVSDNSSLLSWNSIAYSVSSVTALNIPTATIGFGSVALGGTSSEQSTGIQNWGNTQFDISAAETDGTTGSMNCSIGTIDTDADNEGVRFNATSGFSFVNGDTAYKLGPTHVAAGNITDWNQAYPNASGITDAASTSTLYWLLRLPSSGISGSCSGVATVLAAQG